MSSPTALYRLYDDAGSLLYVGIATTPEARWQQHASTAPWWHLVARRQTEWFASRQDAESAERSAIKTEKPRYNRAGSDTPMRVTQEFEIGDEMSVVQFRTRIADVINAVMVNGSIVYITSRGRRVAAVAPVPVADSGV